MPTYAKVRYQDLWHGIDLVYYGRQGRLETDFVVAYLFGGPDGLYIGGYANEVPGYIPSDELLPPIRTTSSYDGGWDTDGGEETRDDDAA